MRRIGLGIAFGFLAAILAFGAYAFGEHRQTHAEATWSVKAFVPVAFNDGSHSPNPNDYVNDWLATLPASCNVEPVYVTKTDSTGFNAPFAVHFYYACP